MTKFEQIGMNYQHDARTKEEALRNFNYSCYCCCMRGMRLDCNHCAIAVVHKHIIAAFDATKNEVA